MTARIWFDKAWLPLNVCRIFLCTDRELEPGTEEEIRTRLDGFTNRIPEAPESLRGEKKYRGLLT